MDYKWLGAVLILAGCGGFGFLLSMSHRQEEKALRSLMGALDYMSCELQYRMTPLPDLCAAAGTESSGAVGRVLSGLARELENQLSPDVSAAMEKVLSMQENLTPSVHQNFRQLGLRMGRFDLDGQLKGLESVRSDCRTQLKALEQNRDIRLRNYQTLGLCAGAALAILLI
jgi:stage III sporulation protein AB